MNETGGRIVAKDSGIGIPGLVVTVFDVDPPALPSLTEEVIKPANWQ
jgi:hypothetical protein